jgi:putative addiction module component (TIGR02574 family)
MPGTNVVGEESKTLGKHRPILADRGLVSRVSQRVSFEMRLKKQPPNVFYSALLPGLLFRRLEGMELLSPDEIGRLTPPERLALIAQLWDSLEQEQLPLTGAQEAELERRLGSLDEDRRNGVTWASLKAELEQRCP